jgi:hypothetical protein
LWYFVKHFADFSLLNDVGVYNDGFIVCLQQVKIVMQPTTCTQQDTVEATQVNNTNTSDLILFIIVEDPDTIDLQIWDNIAEI